MDFSSFVKLLLVPNNFYSVLIFIIFGFYFIDQKKFYYIGVAIFFSLILTSYMKSVWQIPLNPALNKEGWAYPSTHTVVNVVFYGALLLFFRKLWVLAASLVILITSFFSMVYLGYHTWIDITAGIATAIIVLLPFYYWIRDAFNKRALFGIILAAISIVLLCLLPDSSKQWGWKILGILIGFAAFSEVISISRYSRLIRLVSLGLLSVSVITLSELKISNLHIYNLLYGVALTSLMFIAPALTDFAGKLSKKALVKLKP